MQELIDYVQDYYDYAAPSLRHNQAGSIADRDGADYQASSKQAAEWLARRADYVYGTLTAYDIEDEGAGSGEQERMSIPCIIDTEDGIELIQNSKFKIQNEVAIYDLSGRKINGQSSMVKSQLPKGIYITSDGRKVFVR